MLSFVALAAIALVAAQPYRGVFLSNGGRTLSLFELDNADHLATREVTGATTRLDAVDFRATDGKLLGYARTSDTTGAFYVVDPCTGVTSNLMSTGMTPAPVVVTSPNPHPLAGQFDIDVNPLRPTANSPASASCGVRIVGGRTNFAWNVCTNLAIGSQSPLDFDGTEQAATGTPNVAAIGYANNVNNGGAPRSVSTLTTLYAVDATTDSLYVLNIGTGTTTLVGPIGADVVVGAGLDVFTDVNHVPSNRLILKSGHRIFELNPANGAVIDRAEIHDNAVAGESGLAIGRFTCSAPNARSSSSSSSDSHSHSSSSSSSSSDSK